MHQLRIARVCYIPTSCLGSWSPQTVKGASWLSPQAGSSVMCTTCQSLLSLNILQRRELNWGGYSRFILLPLAKWSCFYFFRTLALSRAQFCKVLSHAVRGWVALAFPAICGHGEHSWYFRNAQHLSKMMSTFQYCSQDKRCRNRLMFCFWTRSCFWRTWGSSLCWTICLILFWLKWVVCYFCTLM